MTNTELKRRRNNANQRRAWRRRADRHLSLGLTTSGQPRKTIDTIGRSCGRRYYLEVHGKVRKTILNRFWRQRNKALGLRCDGKPLMFKKHNLPRAKTPEQRLANQRARWKFYYARNLANGLNARGKPRLSILELQWRAFRASIEPELRNAA